MKFLIAPLLLAMSWPAYAVDCATARQYAATYTKEQLADMAKANGITVTKAQKAEYAACFSKQHKRKHR